MNQTPGHRAAEELFIELDDRQLAVRTNIEEVRDYVAATYDHMLVPVGARVAATLEIMRTDAGYVLEGAERIEFATMPVEPLLPVVKEQVRLQFLRSRPDLLWLHAGAVEREGAGVLLSGASGQGKSTLTTSLCERGWRFLSDEIAPVRMNADLVIPFPQAAVRRIHPGHELPLDQVQTLRRETVPIESRNVAAEPVPITAIIFISYSPEGHLGLTRLPKGSAALEVLRNLTNFMDHRAAAVERAAMLARTVPIFVLKYHSPVAAASAVEDLFMTGF